MAKPRASHSGLTRMKAREILHHGEVRGHKLTARQRRFMGARASGQPVRRSHRSSHRSNY